MSQLVRISHPELLLFSSWSAPGSSDENSGRVLGWRSEEMDTPTLISCVASFDSVRAFNAIYIDVHPDFGDFFPNTFRIDISNDGQVWEPIINESDFRAGLATRGSWNFPLITARHIKFLFLADKTNQAEKYFSAFGEFRVMISGIVKVDVSSELDRLWVRENMIDERPEYGWSSSLRPERQAEEISLDLGSINRVSEIRMLSKNDSETFFPEVFAVAYSENNIAWHHLLEENGFLAEPGTWYRWRFASTNIRYLRLHIKEGARTREGKYISQIIELELYAAPELIDKAERAAKDPTPHASVLRSGLVRLGMDGEVREGVVVQGSDRRLRESSTESPGIVELAADGEDRGGVVVQGNDRRLKYSTEDLPGIVRLARDGEVRAGHALQSTDGRIRPATDTSSGLVELAEDGENRPGVVVQGNDRRLRMATIKSPGIIRLADNGSERPNEAVQGNDHRLRRSTVEYPGIMRFARPGEEKPEAAVQGNDPRLREATTEAPGIVELARDGEEGAHVVVQGNDRRLKYASEERAGIVELAPPGGSMAGRAVQASDPRLTDHRPPLSHEHDYAPEVHDYDSHSGYVKVEGELGKAYNTLTDPPAGYAPVSGVNTGEGAGIAGRGRHDGVIGSGRSGGVIGFGLEGGVGVVGAARSGPGGYFLSEKGYSVVVGGEFQERGLYGSDLGLLVRGRTRLMDSLYMAGQDGDTPPVIACYFSVDNKDVVVPGDVMVAVREEGVLGKSRDAGATSVMGVVVEKAPIILGHPEDQAPGGIEGFKDGPPPPPAGMRLVAIAGIVEVRAIVEKNPIAPGDLLMSSIHSGRGEKFNGNNYKPGMIFARSLGKLSKGEGVVKALLVSF